MDLSIIGAGRQSQELSALVRRDGHQVVAHLVTTSHHVKGAVDVVQEPVPAPALNGVGSPGAARTIVDAGPVPAAPAWVAASASIGPDVELADGSAILPMTSLGAGVRLGPWCLVNHGVALAHDVRLGAYVSVGPGASVGGAVDVGDGAVLGLGCVVLPRLSIGEGAVVGGGAVVTRDVPAAAVVMGVPARQSHQLEGWLTTL